MSLVAKAATGETREPVTEGVHIAICVALIDGGEQIVDYKDQRKLQEKIIITWEIPDDTYEYEGETHPKQISRIYTNSLGERATLRQHLEAWRGRSFTDKELAGFDLRNVLGKACQMQIIHQERNNRVYANIKTIMAVPKGMKVPEPSNELVAFDLDEEKALDKLETLPSWVQQYVRGSVTYEKMVGNEEFQELGEDDLPF